MIEVGDYILITDESAENYLCIGKVKDILYEDGIPSYYVVSNNDSRVYDWREPHLNTKCIKIKTEPYKGV